MTITIEIPEEDFKRLQKAAKVVSVPLMPDWIVTTLVQSAMRILSDSPENS